ncbi:RING-H2 finger protein ATL29 [Cinnamomum micranthum f. kanehirae]|uniref:RING-type E3 ubiquitin transferase n=1 Tax=Cinnamomum micranthum f. kanehirae TaxID=337451 RepID=A0A443P982_9MAGN|nr:RING-H2 finger protein ATL29 [Cinnamomum micranthum f. kanehirae]
MPQDPVIHQNHPLNSPLSSLSSFSSERRQNLSLIFAVLLLIFFLVSFFSVYLGRIVAQYVSTIRRSMSLPRGLDPSIISSFPTFSYSISSDRIDPKSANDCAVCLSEFSEDEDDVLRLLTICGHVFHADCIDLWLGTHTTCPVCRCDLEWTGELKEVRISMPEAKDQREEREDEGQPHISSEGRRGESAVEGGADMAARRGRHLAPGERLKRSLSTGHSLPVNGEDDGRLKWRSRKWSRSQTFGEFSETFMDIDRDRV